MPVTDDDGNDAAAHVKAGARRAENVPSRNGGGGGASDRGSGGNRCVYGAPNSDSEGDDHCVGRGDGGNWVARDRGGWIPPARGVGTTSTRPLGGGPPPSSPPAVASSSLRPYGPPTSASPSVAGAGPTSSGRPKSPTRMAAPSPPRTHSAVDRSSISLAGPEQRRLQREQRELESSITVSPMLPWLDVGPSLPPLLGPPSQSPFKSGVKAQSSVA